MWVQPVLTHQDLFRLYCVVAADCGSLCRKSSKKGTLTARRSTIIWKSLSVGPGAVNLIFWVYFFHMLPLIHRCLQLLLWVEIQSTVRHSESALPARAGPVRWREDLAFKELFIVGVLIWGWIYTSIKYLISLWHRSDLFTAVWGRLSGCCEKISVTDTHKL